MDVEVKKCFNCLIVVQKLALTVNYHKQNSVGLYDEFSIVSLK